MKILQTEKLYKLFKDKKNEIFYRVNGSWTLIKKMIYMNTSYQDSRQIVITTVENKQCMLLYIGTENIRVIRGMEWEGELIEEEKSRWGE